MNRIVLIGNGFDLAHGLESDYKSFINWYWRNKFETFRKSQSTEDDDIKLKLNSLGFLNLISEYDDLKANKIRSEITNEFLAKLMDNLGLQNWVDIEHEYFLQLKDISKSNQTTEEKRNDVNKLNKELERIKIELKNYLEFRRQEKPINQIQQIRDKIYSNFSVDDFSVEGLKKLIIP